MAAAGSDSREGLLSCFLYFFILSSVTEETFFRKIPKIYQVQGTRCGTLAMAHKPPSYPQYSQRAAVYTEQQMAQQMQSRKPFELLYEERNGVLYCNAQPAQQQPQQQQQGQRCGPGGTRRTRRTRTTFSAHQIAELERNFNRASYLTPERLREVSVKLGLATNQVKIWFKNRRRRKKIGSQRARFNDDLLSTCSVSPPSLADPTEGYTTPPASLVGNGGRHSFASTPMEHSYSDSLENYIYSNHHNNTNNNHRAHNAAAAATHSPQYAYTPNAWPPQYPVVHQQQHQLHQQHHQQHQQLEYKPLVGNAINTPANINKAYDTCSSATPNWNLANGLTTAQPTHSEVFELLTPKTDDSSGQSIDGVDAAYDYLHESNTKSQQVLVLSDTTGTGNMAGKRDIFTSEGGFHITEGCNRAYYDYDNKVCNNTQGDNFYPSIDTLLKTYNHQNTPTQFGYCFS